MKKTIYIYIYIIKGGVLRLYIHTSMLYIYTRRIDGANALSLLDRFGHVDVQIFDTKVQVFDARFVIIRSLMLKPRSSISDLRC